MISRDRRPSPAPRGAPSREKQLAALVAAALAGLLLLAGLALAIYYSIHPASPVGTSQNDKSHPQVLDSAAAARPGRPADLAATRRVVPLADALDAPLPPGKPVVAITFDDGYRSVREHALPILEQHGFPATMFVPTAYVGDENRWD